MRLWHQNIIKDLPRQQLLGQHRECCALRGKGWGRKHETVDYVFSHSPYKLYQYHLLVIEEMQNRNYKPDKSWQDPNYRGKIMAPYIDLKIEDLTDPIYPEHDQTYLEECLENLRSKNIFILEI